MPELPFQVHGMSSLARAVARGLLKSNRCRPLTTGVAPIEGSREGPRLRLDHPNEDMFFWLSLDGRHLWRGRCASEMVEIQPGFLAVMARLGGGGGADREDRQPSIASPLALVCG